MRKSRMTRKQKRISRILTVTSPQVLLKGVDRYCFPLNFGIDDVHLLANNIPDNYDNHRSYNDNAKSDLAAACIILASRLMNEPVNFAEVAEASRLDINTIRFHCECIYAFKTMFTKSMSKKKATESLWSRCMAAK